MSGVLFLFRFLVFVFVVPTSCTCPHYTPRPARMREVMDFSQGFAGKTAGEGSLCPLFLHATHHHHTFQSNQPAIVSSSRHFTKPSPQLYLKKTKKAPPARPVRVLLAFRSRTPAGPRKEQRFEVIRRLWPGRQLRRCQCSTWWGGMPHR